MQKISDIFEVSRSKVKATVQNGFCSITCVSFHPQLSNVIGWLLLLSRKNFACRSVGQRSNITMVSLTAFKHHDFSYRAETCVLVNAPFRTRKKAGVLVNFIDSSSFAFCLYNTAKEHKNFILHLSEQLWSGEIFRTKTVFFSILKVGSTLICFMLIFILLQNRLSMSIILAKKSFIYICRNPYIFSWI